MRTKIGCVFVCSSCRQTNFEDNVIPVQKLSPSPCSDLLQECLTRKISVNDLEYICLPCKCAIYRGYIPKLSIRNKCKFSPQLTELMLHPLEECLISPIIPFLKI